MDMKKCDMSIEERAKREGIISQLRADYLYDKKSVEFGYIQGAYDQKEVDIDKACEWLKEMLSKCCCYVCYNRGCETPIEGKQECRNECEIYGKRFCEKKEE